MFLLIDNYDSFTYNLAQAFQTLGHDPIVLKNDDPAILELAQSSDLEMVCISPGPGHPANAGLCPEFLNRVRQDVPILGICLGHQLLGLHAGADIAIAPVIIHGKQSEINHNGAGMFRDLPQPLEVGRYHSLVVRENDRTSSQFTVTAKGPKGEIMALQYKDRPWAGVQFHPESVLTPQGLAFLANFPGGAKVQKYTITQILDQLGNGKDLTDDMAAQGFAALMDGELSPAQAGAFLMGLRQKGESARELAQAIACVLQRAVPIAALPDNCIDIVGTGGDGKKSFNCSTAAALTLAGMGYKVVKHGNRAVSSACGAADALEGLGIKLDSDPDAVPAMLTKRNFAFMFAPYFHPGFKNVGPVRKELGTRTLFNILGPMINPARPSHLLMGVYRPELVDLVAQTLSHTHLKKAAIVHGAGGYDELTTMGVNQVAFLDEGQISHLAVNPTEFGLTTATPEELVCRTKEEAVATLRELLSGGGSKAMQDMVILNAGMAIYLLESGITLADAIAKARAGLQAGAGAKVLTNA